MEEIPIVKEDIQLEPKVHKVDMKAMDEIQGIEKQISNRLSSGEVNYVHKKLGKLSHPQVMEGERLNREVLVDKVCLHG